MADARRRALERGAAGGDREAAARLLVERARGGGLPPGGLEALADAAHPGARVALGRAPCRTVEGWAREVTASPATRCSIAALAGLAAVARAVPGEALAQDRAALDACLAAPDDVAALQRLRRRLSVTTGRLALLPRGQRARRHAARAFLLVGEGLALDHALRRVDDARIRQAIGVRLRRMGRWYDASTPPVRLDVLAEAVAREALAAGVPLDGVAAACAEALAARSDGARPPGPGS